MPYPYEWRGERDRRDAYRRYDEPAEPRDARRELRDDADRLGDGLKRGWRRFSDGLRHTMDEDRSRGYGDPHRAGGMFGGEDRAGSVFSHGDGGPRPPPGPHRGKGPRGYVRSDARILEDVSDRLADDGRLDASDIEVIVAAGEVILNGAVRSRPDKRRAEDLAERASGVKQVQNNLWVDPPEAVAADTRREAGTAGAAARSKRPTPRPPEH